MSPAVIGGKGVGSEASFEHGREQLQFLAGLKVTAKAVERHAGAIGADIATEEQAAIHRPRQLPLPEVGAEPPPDSLHLCRAPLAIC